MVEVLQPFFKCYEASLYYIKTRSESSSNFERNLGEFGTFQKLADFASKSQNNNELSQLRVIFINKQKLEYKK